MGSDRHWPLLPLELVVFTAFGHVAHELAAIPPWIGGAISALVVGVVLRFLDPTLKRLGERFAARRDAVATASIATNSKDPTSP